MGLTEILFLTALVILFVVELRIYFKFIPKPQRRPITTVLCSMSLGMISLIIINLLSAVTGVFIGYNLYTIGFSLVTSIPGVISMLFLNLIFL